MSSRDHGVVFLFLIRFSSLRCFSPVKIDQLHSPIWLKSSWWKISTLTLEKLLPTIHSSVLFSTFISPNFKIQLRSRHPINRHQCSRSPKLGQILVLREGIWLPSVVDRYRNMQIIMRLLIHTGPIRQKFSQPWVCWKINGFVFVSNASIPVTPGSFRRLWRCLQGKINHPSSLRVGPGAGFDSLWQMTVRKYSFEQVPEGCGS